MAITMFMSTCVERPEYQDRLAHKVAPYADLAIGVALVIIAILGTQGVIPMSNSAAYAVLGLGSAFAGLRILNFLAVCKVRTGCTKDLYLFKANRKESHYQEEESGDLEPATQYATQYYVQ